MRRPRILLLAAVPPPLHGQALMGRYLVSAQWDWCDVIHVPVSLSSGADEVGRPRVRKLFRLLRTLAAVWRARVRGAIDILYFVPAPPHPVPMLRDLLLLPLVRPCARMTVFHFHAGGFGNTLRRFGPAAAPLIRRVYRTPRTAIVPELRLVPEVAWIAPQRTLVIPNGIPDAAGGPRVPPDVANTILYAGSLSTEKGVLDLLLALLRFDASRSPCELALLGPFRSEKSRREVEALIGRMPRGVTVHLCGEVDGDEKWRWFSGAACLCFPSRDLEAQPLALLEAMCWSLPIVATDWRTHRDVAGDAAVYVPPGHPAALADALAEVLGDPPRRRVLGSAGRKRYEERHTLEAHLGNMEQAFRDSIGS